MAKENAQGISEDAKETNSKSYSEISKEQIGDSPFEKISGGDEVFIALGQYRLTGERDDKQLAKLEKAIKGTDWKFMVAVIGAIAKQTVDQYRGEL